MHSAESPVGDLRTRCTQSRQRVDGRLRCSSGSSEMTAPAASATACRGPDPRCRCRRCNHWQSPRRPPSPVYVILASSVYVEICVDRLVFLVGAGTLTADAAGAAGAAAGTAGGWGWCWFVCDGWLVGPGARRFASTVGVDDEARVTADDDRLVGPVVAGQAATASARTQIRLNSFMVGSFLLAITD